MAAFALGLDSLRVTLFFIPTSTDMQSKFTRQTSMSPKSYVALEIRCRSELGRGMRTDIVKNINPRWHPLHQRTDAHWVAPRYAGILARAYHILSTHPPFCYSALARGWMFCVWPLITARPCAWLTRSVQIWHFLSVSEFVLQLVDFQNLEDTHPEKPAV